MQPIVNGLEEEMGEELTVLRVDIFSPGGDELKQRYSVRTTPTFVLFDGNGEEVFRQIGTLDAEKIRELVRE